MTTACGDDSAGGVDFSAEENSMDLVKPKHLDTGEQAEKINEKAREIRENADSMREAAEAAKDSPKDSEKSTKSSGSSGNDENPVDSVTGEVIDKEASEHAGEDKEPSTGERIKQAVGETKSDEDAFTIRDDASAGAVYSQRSDIKAIAEKYVGKTLDELEETVGEPVRFMEMSGWGTNGKKSGNAVYNGFVVVCERRGGSNTWKITEVR